MSSPQLPRTTSTANTTPASGDTGVRFDDHGVLPIPDSERDCSPWELFWIWCGANIAPINWVLGALGIALGLSLIETLIVVSVGNVFGCAVFGLFNVIGHRTAVNQMVLGRSAFGIAGAVLPALVQGLLTMAWVGVNTWVVLDLVLAVLEEIGIRGGMELKVLVATAIMMIQLALALYGFYAIRTFEKYTVPLTIAVMVAMTVVALARTHLDWTAAAAPTPGQKLTAVTQLITAIGVGWGLTWIPYAADYSRFARPTLRARTVFWASAAGMYLPTVWLAALGACLASAGGGADPSTLVVSTFGALAVPVLVLIMHGPIATNILNLYSCSLAALTVGIRIARWKITLFAGAVASAVLAVFINSSNFAHTFDNWMVSILMWISPWMSILLVDYFLVRRQTFSIPDLYRDGTTSIYGKFNARGLVSLAAGLLASWSWQYGVVPAMQGPVAKALGNTDFSWLSGSLVAGGIYGILSALASARRAGA
ncbi:purine-cytosine permease family protein [Nocardia sp. NBC_01009]|uniref:purine-cytosine permease family protein n=1 Tax=Nocardia sp. NBC_01009 TaxID=2975996 RepID=UPI00386AEA37|nr:cytosine permease [Nocardia sp. NBC_01009]